jgi:UDP-glucuronate 4-epimerase
MLAGQKVLLTGVTGRIGEAIAERFARSCELWGLARYSTEGSIEKTRERGVVPVIGDYATGELSQVPTDFDYVVHVAADVAPHSAEAGMRANSDGAARLMKHCRSAKAFLHMSTTGVYKQHPDPNFIYSESADLGGQSGGQYSPTKLAGEGAVRAGAIILDLPTVICRQNVQYGGAHVPGGLFDHYLDAFIESGEVPVPTDREHVCGALHVDDICDFVEPSLKAASVPATIVNWGGDEAVRWRDVFEYVGTLVGTAPRFVPTSGFELHHPSCMPDPAHRMNLVGRARVDWRLGIRRSLEVRHPGTVLTDGD